MKKFTTQKFINKAKLIHNNKYDYSVVNYINNRIKIKIMCSVHGEFLQRPHSHLSGQGCLKCENDNRKYILNELLEIFNKKHNNKYNYKKFQYKSYRYKSIIICKKHGEFSQNAHDHLSGRGCPKCGKNIQKLNQNEFIEKIKKIHGNKYDYSKINYINSKTKVEIICKKHGIFWQRPNDHLNGRGCSKCNHIISRSEMEFLDYMNIPNTKNSRQVLILRKKVDGYDKKTNTIYEFLGDFWHGNLDIYNYNDINPIKKITFKKLNDQTFEKLNKLKSFDYNVKYIWENDWKKYKDNIDIKPKISNL